MDSALDSAQESRSPVSELECLGSPPLGAQLQLSSSLRSFSFCIDQGCDVPLQALGIAMDDARSSPDVRPLCPQPRRAFDVAFCESVPEWFLLVTGGAIPPSTPMYFNVL